MYMVQSIPILSVTLPNLKDLPCCRPGPKVVLLANITTPAKGLKRVTSEDIEGATGYEEIII